MPQFFELNTRQQSVLEALLKESGGPLQSSEIHQKITIQGVVISQLTIKRLLSELTSLGLVGMSGGGRSISYKITSFGRFIFPIDSKAYCAMEPDKRFGLHSFNFGLFDNSAFDPFTMAEHEDLTASTRAYEERVRGLSPTLQEKELERFIIELSWKSSKIEGNTYTLLDTERLLLHGIEAPGHDKSEAQMILNHKEAFKFIRENIWVFKNFTRANMEQVHKLLVSGLNVNVGLRMQPVGVTGSVYRPLDNIHQIAEAVWTLCDAVEKMESPYSKALLILLGVGYIQPFEDGNKRTARLMANAILLAHACAPLSYRSVDENDYREAMLVFYELNSLVPFKKIFVEQYRFATENYLIS